jgi:hypothetical protein
MAFDCTHVREVQPQVNRSDLAIVAAGDETMQNNRQQMESISAEHWSMKNLFVELVGS